MSFRSLWRVSLLLISSVLATATVLVGAETGQFDDPLERFQPREEPTEEEQDQAKALTFYGMAREAEARGDTSDALRWFQRTLRYDPACLPAARAAMRLAIQMERPQLGIDAALHITDCRNEDRLPLRYMALHLTRQGRWEAAVNLYERTLGIEPREPTNEDDAVLMMEMARLCHLIGNDQKAAAYFTQVLKALDTPRNHNISPRIKRELLGENGATYQLIGSCFLSAGNIEAAKSAFKTVSDAAPNPARAACNAAAVHYHSGQFEDALRELDICFQHVTEEDGIEPFILLKETLAKLGRANEVIDYLVPLHKKHPKNAALGHWLAQQLFDAEKYDGAEPIYVSLIDKSPTSTAFQHLLEIYLARSDYKKVTGILAAVADKTGTLDALGSSLDRVVESSEAVEAVAALGKPSPSNDLETDHSRTLAAGLIALAAGRFDLAQPLMSAAVASSADQGDNLLLIWGLDLLSADRFDEAVRVFQKGLDRKEMSDGQRAAFNYYLAAALELQGHTDDALVAARAAAKLNEDSAPLHVRVAWVLYHGDRKSEAAREYRALVDRFDGSYESEQTRDAVRQARLVLSTLCVSDHRVEEAAEWLEQVLDEFPDDPGALNDLGYLWADENQHIERAHRMIEQAVDADPENAAYRDSLGWVLYRKGRFEEAIVELTKAVEADADPVVLDHLGDAYAKANQADQARATWERAAAKFSEAGLTEEAAKVRKKLVPDK